MGFRNPITTAPVRVVGTVDVNATGTVGIDTSAGPVDVNAGQVIVANGTVQFTNTDAVLIVERATGAVDIAPGSSAWVYGSNGLAGSIYVDQLLVLVSSPNKDIANLGISELAHYAADPEGIMAYLGELGIAPLGAPTSFDNVAQYDAAYIVPLPSPQWIGGEIDVYFINNNPAGGATINETLTVTVYGKLATQPIQNPAFDPGSSGIKSVLTLGAAPPIESTPYTGGGLIKALNLAINISAVTTPGEIRVQDQSGSTYPLFSFTPTAPGDHYLAIALPPGGYQSDGGLLLFQEAGAMAGTVTLTAIF